MNRKAAIFPYKAYAKRLPEITIPEMNGRKQVQEEILRRIKENLRIRTGSCFLQPPECRMVQIFCVKGKYFRNERWKNDIVGATCQPLS